MRLVTCAATRRRFGGCSDAAVLICMSGPGAMVASMIRDALVGDALDRAT